MAESNRDRLIDAASDLFYEHGFHAIGLDRILTEVGVTKTTFYNHFESKDALIIAVLENRDRQELEEIITQIRAIGGADPRAQLLAFFDTLEAWFDQVDFRGCMFINAAAEFPSPHDPIHITASKHSQHLSTELRRLGALAGAADPDSLANQLMVVVSGSIVARHAAMNSRAAAVARAAAEIIIDAHLPRIESAV